MDGRDCLTRRLPPGLLATVNLQDSESPQTTQIELDSFIGLHFSPRHVADRAANTNTTDNALSKLPLR